MRFHLRAGHRPGRYAVLMAALAVLVPFGLVTPSARAALPDFYTPPASLGPGEPGALIRSQPMDAYALPGVPLHAKAWRIMYRSTKATGGSTAVTGTVLVPDQPWRGQGHRPLVGFAAGSQGLADRCAASRRLAAGTEYESAVLSQMLSRGWAVVLTDYPGLGTPGDHPYVVGQALGKSVLDSIRAARRLPGAELSRHGPVAIYGYSEGGLAAGWALQLQPTYAPELELEGGAVGAAPANLPKLVPALNGGPFAFLIPYTGIGFDAAYPGLRLQNHLNARGRALADRLRQTCIEDAIAQGLLMTPKDYRAYVTGDPFDTAQWRDKLRANSLGYRSPQVPVLVGAGRQDEVIPFRQSVELCHRWQARGVDVHFADIPISEHLTGGVAFSLHGLPFLADRFAGSPTNPSSC